MWGWGRVWERGLGNGLGHRLGTRAVKKKCWGKWLGKEGEEGAGKRCWGKGWEKRLGKGLGNGVGNLLRKGFGNKLET